MCKCFGNGLITDTGSTNTIQGKINAALLLCCQSFLGCMAPQLVTILCQISQVTKVCKCPNDLDRFIGAQVF